MSYTPTREVTAAGLFDGEKMTALGLFVVTGMVALGGQGNAHSVAVHDHLMRSAKSAGFSHGKELARLFQAQTDFLTSARMQKLCRQAVAAIGPNLIASAEEVGAVQH